MSGLLEVQMDDWPVETDQSSAPVSIPERPRSTEKIHPSHGLGPDRPTAEQIKTAIDAGRTSPQTSPTTVHWGHDVEQSFVSTIWHYPQFLAMAQRELDFDVHVSVPAFRKILQAVSIVYGKIGEADWTCVLHCIREIDAFEEVGRLEGLNRIFTDDDHYPEGRKNPELIIGEFIELLKLYTIARQVNPYESVRCYTRGHGFLQKNKLATKPEHPAAVGKIPRCARGQRCRIAGWPTGDPDTLNLTLDLER